MSAKANSHWSKQDVDYMITEKAKGKPMSVIAKVLGRSEGACYHKHKEVVGNIKNPFRRKSYPGGYEVRMNNGQPPAKILERLNLSLDQVKQALQTPIGRAEPRPSPEAEAALRESFYGLHSEPTIGGRVYL